MNQTPVTQIIAGFLVVLFGIASLQAADVPFALQGNDKATGEALAGVSIDLKVDNGQQSFKTDDSGLVDLTIPDTPKSLQITAKIASYVPMTVSWKTSQS